MNGMSGMGGMGGMSMGGSSGGMEMNMSMYFTTVRPRALPAATADTWAHVSSRDSAATLADRSHERRERPSRCGCGSGP